MRAVLLVAGAFAIAASCQRPSPATPGTGRSGPPREQFTITQLIGGWHWTLRTAEAGTTRVEEETWRFRPGARPTELVGRYVRTVDVTSDDHVPFNCNQRPSYRQRAVFDVVVEITRSGFAIRETLYHTEPTPCDHGWRHVGTYAATLDGDHLALRWDGGTQTLTRTDEAVADLAADPWPSVAPFVGPWRWDATSYDDDGNLRDETEWWEITKATDTRFDATYRRRVTVRTPDGSLIPCAHASNWTFDDAYVLTGQREEEHWHFYELSAAPGDHPCLKTTPHRALDEATGEQLGDYLLLEWRGKRKQILYRGE